MVGGWQRGCFGISGLDSAWMISLGIEFVASESQVRIARRDISEVFIAARGLGVGELDLIC